MPQSNNHMTLLILYLNKTNKNFTARLSLVCHCLALVIVQAPSLPITHVVIPEKRVNWEPSRFISERIFYRAGRHGIWPNAARIL